MAGLSFELEARSEGDCRVLVLKGQITEQDCDELEAALGRDLTSGPARLVVDMEGLLYLSSSGLAVLVKVHKKLGEAGCRMILTGLSPKVRKLLALTRLDEVIETAENVAEALGRE